MHIRPVLFASLALTACLVSPQGDQAAIRAAIDSGNARWSAAVAAGNADSLGVIYAANARMMPPNGPTNIGRDKVIAGFAPMFAIGQWTITLTTDSVWINGPLVFESGTWVSTFTPGPNAAGAPPIPPRDNGKYLQRWIQEDGHWVVADDIWNSDNPPPAPPPVARPAPRPTTTRRRR